MSTRADRTHAPRRRKVVASLLIRLSLPVLLLAGCAADTAPARTFTLETLSDSGVTGTVALRQEGDRTSVTITVDPAGNLDMPAHIHPGTCDDLAPQPKFPLENVSDGESSTVVPATIDELLTGNLAVNLHKANDDLGTYTACVDLK